MALLEQPGFALAHTYGSGMITAGLGKTYLNGEVTLLQGSNLRCRIQFGTDRNGEEALLVRWP